MKKLILIVSMALTLAAVSCGGGDDSRRNATSVGSDGWVFEGWACAPDTAKALKGLSPADYCTDQTQNDYLYMKFSARASDKAIQAGSQAMMQTTCREAARLLVAGDGLAKIVGEQVEKASGVSDGQSTGVAIVAQVRGQVGGIGTYNCCALDKATGRCIPASAERENWEECQCVGFMKFPGGQQKFESFARAAQ